MKKIFVAFILAILSTSVFPQTFINGFINTNTTWNLAGSPYIVNGNTYLVQGNTLTIEPGVVVQFDSAKALQIDGELHAIGTESSRIKFTSLKAIPAPGDWAKIHFSDVSVSAVLDSSGTYLTGSIMKYCDVEYGGGIGFGAIHIITSSPYFSHCRISHSASNGIYSSMTIYKIDSSSVTNCQESGLHFYRYYQNHCNLVIQDDTLLNNSGGGIFLDDNSFLNCNYRHSTLIQRCIFLSNSPFAFFDAGNSWDSLLVFENRIENNFGNGPAFKIHATTYAVACNKFINNQNNEGVLIIGPGDEYNSFTSSYHIQENVIAGNTASSASNIININIGANDKNIYFTNNIIKDNQVPGGSIMALSARITNIFQIHHNDFRDNTAEQCISLSDPNGTSSNHTYCDVRYNNLVNPGCNYEFYNNVPYGGPNILADSIYWGSSSTAHIDSAIYDYFDLANQSVLFYQPFLLFPTEADTSCHALSIGISEHHKNNFTSKIFPNPCSGNAMIRFEHMLSNAVLEILDITGKRVHLMENISGIEFPIDCSEIPPGVYFYSVTEKNGSLYQGKLVTLQ